MATRIASLLLLGALAALLVGCGGDTRRAESGAETKEATSPVIPPPTQPSPRGPVQVTRVTDPARRAYVARVDAICHRIDPERNAQEERVGAAGGTAAAAKAYDDTIALGWRELHEIEAVPVPPGDAALLKANVFSTVRAQLALRVKMGKALAAQDVPTLRRLRAELDNTTRALTGFARGYGFRVCGEA